MTWRRSSIAKELRELDARRAVLLEQLERANLRASIVGRILGGFAANSNPDQGITRVEVLRAYELAEYALDDGERLSDDPPSFSDLHTDD